MDLFLFTPRTAPTVAGTSFLFFRSAVFLYLRKSTGVNVSLMQKQLAICVCQFLWYFRALFTTQSEIASAPQWKINFAEPTPPGAIAIAKWATGGETPISARCWLFCARSEPCARAASLWQINHIPGARWWPSAWNCVLVLIYLFYSARWYCLF